LVLDESYATKDIQSLNIELRPTLTVIASWEACVLQRGAGILPDFVEEALRIISEANKRGIQLRLLGATAVKLHSPKFARLYEDMQRALTDLDLISYARFRPQLKDFLKSLGYTADDRFIALHGHKRQIYFDETNKRTVDIFIDKLEFCHIIDFTGRLELDNPTITLADILLEKMQIVQINEKDIKDTIIMLREHEVGEIERETVNAKYIAKRLSDDWGFYYTVTINLKKVKDFLPEFKALSDSDRGDVASKVDKLLAYIEKESKSFGWKMRARVGPSKKWYTEVEELSR